MKYLVSVKDTLSSDELAKLRATAAFPLELPPDAQGVKPAVVRKKPNQLYEPTVAMRELGLPLLDWGEGKWKSNSDEGELLVSDSSESRAELIISAKMLAGLGLRRFPPVDVLLGIAAGSAPTNAKALNYLLANISTHYINFDPTAFSQVAFIPATRDGRTFLAKPGEVSCVSQDAAMTDRADSTRYSRIGTVRFYASQWPTHPLLRRRICRSSGYRRTRRWRLW
jgi:hypothetical protein